MEDTDKGQKGSLLSSDIPKKKRIKRAQKRQMKGLFVSKCEIFPEYSILRIYEHRLPDSRELGSSPTVSFTSFFFFLFLM